MNITPITKKYTNPYNTSYVSFGKNGSVAKNEKSVFSCDKMIVRNTLNEFSNSRGNCLADIDLTDIYIPTPHMNLQKLGAGKKSKDSMTADLKNINFLADMPLCDAYELPKENKNLQMPFGGAYPQYLIDQDAVEQYETTSYGIKDIAKSTYCSFGGAPEEKVLSKVVKFVKRILPL